MTAGGRVPPHNTDAEVAVLGAMMLRRDVIDDVVGLVAPDDFYTPAHGHIAAAIFDLHGAGQPVDATTVIDRLRRDGNHTPELAQTVVGILALDRYFAGNAARYAHIIQDHALLRRMIGVAYEIAELGYDAPDDVPAAIARAEEMVFAVAQQRRSRAEATALLENLAGWIDRLEARYNSGGTVGVPTGLVDLDCKLQGLRPGQLITLAGRPGMGKSALATNIAVNAAGAGHPTLFVSVEMPVEEIVDRIVASEARVDLTRLRSARLHDSDWPKLGQATTHLGQIPLWTLDDPNATTAAVAATARRLKARGQLDLVVVDYLQLMTAANRRENRQVEVAEIAGGLKRVARDLQTPVIALAQLNRSLEMRTDKRPQLADLRESGAIENDSDVVLGIYRDDYYNTNSPDRGVAEILILKQRNGPTGTVKAAYLEIYGRFANMARAGDI